MTTGLHRLVASGWSLHLPGADLAAALAGPLGRPPGDWARAEAPPAERAGLVVGRKGLLYKEPATRLALCAVHRALGLPPGRRPDRPVAPRTAVVACSNLGNVETVARVTRTVTAEGGHAVSVLDAPNVSSNVVASTVALWFGFGGPNLMVCSGARAGSDGLWLAGLLLRAGRADRVVLVGVEPDDEVASALYAADDPTRPPRSGRAADDPARPPRSGRAAEDPARRLRAGAACVVLRAWRPEAPGTAQEALVELAPGAAPVAPPLTVG
ncbi:MAG TPA: beta-ketoacyl synthase N-terminal-like domain-containing protein, partial [Pilimelia sp.]|nr:beta-ketoacyl synthase N-terminal-like domain-containing protein [Pilimelia sp.]